jgi:hypothetical protein
MERLRQEIRLLMSRLEASRPPADSRERAVLERLRNLAAAAEKTSDPRALAPQMALVTHFWLNAVDWCSQLSKDIEKIIIIQEELSNGE